MEFLIMVEIFQYFSSNWKCKEKRGLELLHANYAARTNSQNNTTLQLAPTPLNSMSALRSQNNTPCLANLVFL